jgi:uncharacterized membrane protein
MHRDRDARTADLMLAEKSGTTFGWRVYGLGAIALGVVCLATGDFHPGQPVPKDFPARSVLAGVVAAFMLIAGIAIEWRRTRAWATAAFTAYFALIVVLLMNGAQWLAHWAEFLPCETLAIQLAITAGGLVVYASVADIDAALAARLVRAGRFAFGACALVFGVAHFVYLDLTAPLVPKWLPPGQVFWAYATGIAHIAAGIAILGGVQARLAAVLLTVMYTAFTVFVHVPMLLATPSSHWVWNENAVNIALIGAAWVVADSLARPSRP